jgi:hypothetical protein
MVPAIFKDKSQQDLFDKQGFVIVDFLNEQEVDLLNQNFDELHPSITDQGGFVSGSYSNDLNYKKKASDNIIAVFAKHFERLFTNYQTFGAAFLYKPPTQGSELGVHQDWTIVDEEKFVALNCWVPLTDVNNTNGALHVMPGSQYAKYNTLRAPTIPFFFSGSENEIITKTIPIYVKAGMAVILNQSVIHYSPPNRSGKIRKAITAGIKTQGAPMTFHYKGSEDEIKKFEMSEDFLISFQNFATSIFEQPQSGKLIGAYPYKNKILAKETLIPLITRLKKDAGYSPNTTSRISSLFSKLLPK